MGMPVMIGSRRAFICVGGSACYDGHCETHVTLIVCFDWGTVGFWVCMGLVRLVFVDFLAA